MLIDLKYLINKYNLKIRGIIHGGAHNAEESTMYSEMQIEDVIWLEANPEKAEYCKNLLKDKIKNIVITEAISDKNGEKVDFNITNNGESSSILDLKNHKKYYPDINVVKKLKLETKRIDTIIDENIIEINNYNFLNLDLQGIELRAIKSLGDYLKNIDYIYTEVNKSELYNNCDKIEDIDSYLMNQGFIRVETAWTHAEWGDAFYIRGPKLKIIITSYNNEDWVQTNIESLLEQTYTNYEVLYIDDCSTDQTFEIAEYLLKNNDKFKLIKNEKNMSKSYSFMKIAKNSINDTDIVLFVDGDDWIPYNNIFEQVANYYIKNNPWVAYSKMICYPSLQESSVHGVDFPDKVHKFNLYRQYPFISSHLKTMKGFLFKNINENDFKYQNEWVRYGDDVAIMCAAMEQSPKNRIGIMDFVAYVYNQSDYNRNRNEIDYNNGKKGELHIRSIKPYLTITDNHKKYVSPRILGRLGNQMFEIATAYSLAIDNKCSLKVSTQNGIYTSQLGEIGSPYDYKENIFRNVEFLENISDYDIWNEPSFSYSPINYKFEKNLYIEGQFQSEKYFKHNRSKILELFSCNENIKQYILSKYGEILSKETVSLHIRRGDYLLVPDYHPICGLDYYDKAISLFPNIDKILIFTDDSQWAKNVFTEEKYIIISGEKDYIDLYMMSMCKHNIIANSSFSWWGAWLNNNPNKVVVAPINWFGTALSDYDTKDLIPSSWIKL